jgi:type IV secretion system protein TrbD
MAFDELSKAPLHQSLVRPLLLAGAELAPAVLELFLTFLFAFGFGFSLFSLSFALAFASLSHLLLLRAAKADPQLCAVYARHIRYQSFYPAAAHPAAPGAAPASSWY